MMRLAMNEGKKMYDFCGKLFPIGRSLTGKGVRETLRVINEHIEDTGYIFSISEIPTGTRIFDWTVPQEWEIKDAYIEDETGKHIIDYKDNNLHVLGYSTPMDEWMDLSDMGGYLYTQPDQPDVIPYVTSYYSNCSGFCMSEKQKQGLQPGKYHLYCDSILFDGSLTYADLLIRGDTDEEIMITSYICHPSMANNECSGPALLTEIIRYVASLKRRRYTYRFVLNPETIGSIAYLATQKHMEHLKNHLVAGVVLSCVGDDRDYSIIESRYGKTLADRTLQNILKFHTGDNYSDYSFLYRGSDERQYNAPGINLPVVGFCRSKYGIYPEYHTSADDMNLVNPAGFQGSYEVMTQFIDALEWNKKYKVTVLGEPQLGKRGLYPTTSPKGSYDEVGAMVDFIAYCDGKNDLIEISEIIGIPINRLILIIRLLSEHRLLEVVE